MVDYTNDLEDFDASDVEEEIFEVLPSGDYLGYVTRHEWMDIGGDRDRGQLVKLTLAVEKDGMKYTTFDRLNYRINTSPPGADEAKKARLQKAKNISKGTIKSICVATGKMDPKGFHEFYGKQMLIRLEVEEYEPGKFSNRIKRYMPPDAKPALPAEKPQQASTTKNNGDDKPAWM